MWPDNDDLDELPRAPANLCDGELEFVTIKTGHPVGELPSAHQHVCGKREGWAREGKYDPSLKVCFEHPPTTPVHRELETKIQMGY